MGRKIKDFSNGAYLEYDKGNFDDWCVYLVEAETRKPLRDEDCFQKLKYYADKYGANAIYGDCVKIYDLTGKTVDLQILQEISRISAYYVEDAIDMDIYYSFLYAAMISEENKAYSRLGKRIKRLGFYKLLIENYSVVNSANFMKNMKWREIDILCKERGF